MNLNHVKVLDAILFCIIRKYRESKMMIVMEDVFLDRIIKTHKIKAIIHQNINFNFMKKAIQKME